MKELRSDSWVKTIELKRKQKECPQSTSQNMAICLIEKRWKELFETMPWAAAQFLSVHQAHEIGHAKPMQKHWEERPSAMSSMNKKKPTWAFAVASCVEKDKMLETKNLYDFKQKPIHRSAMPT